MKNIGPNIQKLHKRKTIGKSYWKKELPQKDEALLLFEIQRFELLKSDDLRKIAEIDV